jgi:hypothetical protein
VLFNPPAAGSYTIQILAWGDQAGSEAPVMLVSIDDNNPTGGNSIGALAIKNKLIELHQSLLGETLEMGDEELEASYQFVVETWQDRSNQNNNNQAYTWPYETCRFFLSEHHDADGAAQFREDNSHMLYTWTSLLIYLMTDFEYLHE